MDRRRRDHLPGRGDWRAVGNWSGQRGDAGDPGGRVRGGESLSYHSRRWGIAKGLASRVGLKLYSDNDASENIRMNNVLPLSGDADEPGVIGIAIERLV